MRKFLLCLMLTLFGLSGGVQLMAQSVSSEPVPGLVRVKLQREVASRISQGLKPMSNGIVTTGITPFDRVSQKVKAVSMKRLVPYSPKFEEKHKAAGLDLWYEISFDEGSITPAAAANLYKSVPGVQKVAKVRPIKLIGGTSFRAVTPAEVAKASAAAATPAFFNDPMLAQQWHYDNDGSMPYSVAGADINAAKAWAIETGKSDVLVAVIDGGIQYDHPDLQKNVFVNQAELNGTPGVDDDGNGFVDDIYGYNFVIMSGDVSAHDHGTHVAGTVAAVNNNGIGVSGVAGGSGEGGVKMLSCQVFDNRSSRGANTLAAFTYAADMGASIAQCSWGWDTPGVYDEDALEGIDYFNANGGGDKMSGGLCIFANGNTGEEGDYYPGCYDPVVAVGAMTADLKPASYSTRGDWCDVTAPGGLLDFGTQYGVLSTLPKGQYGYNEGTSMATPHVSGIAALILSKFGNKEFPTETLRQQLVSSVNDFYTTNPEVAGKFGSGYIDAYKALQLGSGAAPSPVTDFTLTPSQDNVLIEWTIPEAEEKSVDHHVIYYSTEAFTPDGDLRNVRSVNVDTKFMSSGDKMSYELGGLNSLTTYYIAIMAVNRYGTSAAVSEVKSAKTNAGPKVSLSTKTVSMTEDAAAGTPASANFVINNDGAGMLKYTMSAATVSASLSTSSVNKATPGKVVSPKSSIIATAVSENPVVTADFMQGDYPKNLTYSNGLSAYVGDNDLEKPNAEAQYFYVDPKTYPDGFNLTQLKVGSKCTEKPVIEVYNGASSISKASLLTTVEYDWFMNNYPINLNEQIYFKPGSSFWVVVKFPKGQDRPLGAARTNVTEDIRSYSFYSDDNGETWSQLSEVLREGNLADIADELTWDITAVSQNPDWSSVLNPTPSEGTVRPGEKQEVTLSTDGQKMVNGTYKYNLYVNTNESDNPKQKLTVNMTVKGQKPELSSAKMIDFGKMLVGEEKTITVEIANNGYGAFAGSGYNGMFLDNNLTVSSDQFDVPGFFSAFGARNVSTLDVTYRPTTSGNHSATVLLTDKNGLTHSFVVSGVASMPAQIGVTPTEIDFGDLEVGGEAKTGTITIKNSGEYPLSYVFPKFSNETIENVGRVHKYGYTYVSNLDGATGFEYDNNPDIANEIDITSQFTSNNWQSEAIDLGFQFPFYGAKYDKVHITSHGSVEFNTTDGIISCMVPTASCVKGLGYISAFANSGNLSMGANSKVTYGRQDGKFVVKYKDVQTVANGGNGAMQNISFHMALCPDGSVECYYDDYEPETIFYDGKNIFVGVVDVPGSDPFVVTDNDAVYDEGSMLYQSIRTGSAIKIAAPSQSVVSNISSPSGVINIGETKEITVSAAATEGMYAGAVSNVLTIISNDPKTPGTSVILKANIVGDNLKPVVEYAAESVDFGSVFRTSKAVKSLLVRNVGTDVLNVKSVTVKGGKFTVDPGVAGEFSIPAGSGKDIIFTLPTETEGAVSDEIEIVFADETSKTMPITGTVIGVPEWGVNPEAIEETTAYGVNVNKEITVTNSGNEDLAFSVEPSPYFNMVDQVADANSSVDYRFKASTDYSDIKCDWVDLTKDEKAVHQDMLYYYENTDYYKVELPFEFPFYGKNYKTMYIYNTGFVSFSEHTDYKEFPAPPAELPSTDTFYSNIIAPFWGNHSMGEDPADGTYYKAEDDHVVVSFVTYGNSMMGGFDFQLLLYKDGHYKFQYHMQDDGWKVGTFGLAGIQDETCKRGINLQEEIIQDGNAVEFYPVKSFTVAKGGNVTLPVEIKADRLAGEYEDNIVFNTNVPTQPVVELPVRLTITGEAKPVFPESVGGESVADEMNMPEIDYDFEVANEGSKAFKITNVVFNPDPTTDPDFDWENFDWDTYMPVPAYLFVYTTYEDPWFGETVTDWMQWQPGMEIEVGKEPVKFQVKVMDQGMPMDIDLPITFTLEGLDEAEKVVPFRHSFTLSPVMTTDKPELVINTTDEGYDKTGKFTISNEGEYKLTYTLRLDPNGVGEEPEEDNMGGDPGIDPMLGRKASAPLTDGQRAQVLSVNGGNGIVAHANNNLGIYDVPQNMEYTNIMYYPVLDVANPQMFFMGTGDANLTDNFYAATRYTAPAEGFNLTDLYFYGTVGNLENVDIEATVVGSSDVTSDRIIGKGKLRVEKEEMYEGRYVGRPRVLTFDKPVYINPADTFYVVVKYPAGYGASAVLAPKAESFKEGRYMAWLKDYGWIDMGQEMKLQYNGSFGYFMTCVETKEGKPWIALDSTVPTEGEIAPGEALDVKLNINEESAYFDRDNKAVVVIKTNDPGNKLVNYPVTFNSNSAPVITVPDGTITVPEAETATMEISVADIEGDGFTVSVADESGIATVKSYVIDGTEGTGLTDGAIVVPAGKNLKANIELAPGHGTAGLHTLTVTAADANGKASSVVIPYNVEFVNRAPEYTGDETAIEVVKGQSSGVIDMTSLFTDPDGDAMTFTASLPFNRYASLFTNGNSVMIQGIAVGKTKITFTATDANDAVTSKDIDVNVVTATGIGSITTDKDIDVYPNPVIDRVNVTLGESAEDVTYYVYDNSGRLMTSAHADNVAAGETRSLDMSGFAAGVYRLKVSTSDRNYTVSVIKK